MRHIISSSVDGRCIRRNYPRFIFGSPERMAPAKLRKELERLNRCWNALANEQETTYQVYPAVPEKFLRALQQVTNAITEYSMVENAGGLDGELQRFYFDALHFARICELFDVHSVFDITMVANADGRPVKMATPNSRGNRTGATLCLRNIVPAPLLAPRLALAHSTVLFSAYIESSALLLRHAGAAGKHSVGRRAIALQA